MAGASPVRIPKIRAIESPARIGPTGTKKKKDSTAEQRVGQSQLRFLQQEALNKQVLDSKKSGGGLVKAAWKAVPGDTRAAEVLSLLYPDSKILKAFIRAAQLPPG